MGDVVSLEGGLEIRPATTGNLDSIVAIENLAYPFPWSRRVFNDCFRAGYHCRTLCLEGEIVGYAVVMIVADEYHILNICISPAYQKRGLGHRFLQWLLGYGRDTGLRTVFLEVRVSNKSAIRLYRKLGFDEMGRRKGYYPAGRRREDALLLSRTL